MYQNRKRRGVPRQALPTVMELNTEKKALLRERQNLNQRRQGVADSYSRSLSSKMIQQLKPLIEQIVRDIQQESGQIRHQLSNIKQLQTSVIQELQESNFDDRPQQRTRINKLIELRQMVDELVEESGAQNSEPEPTSKKLTRINSSAVVGSVTERKTSIGKQIEDLQVIEAKVFKEILTLRSEKLQLMKQLNDQTKRANAAVRQLKRNQKEIKTNREYPLIKKQSSDKDSIIHKLKREQNGKLRKITQPQYPHIGDAKYRQIIQLQNIIQNLQSKLSKAHQHIQLITNLGAEQYFKRQIQILQEQLRVELDRNTKLQAGVEQAYRQQKQVIEQLKADNQELRMQAIQILHHPQRKKVYMVRIKQLEAQIAKQNAAKNRFLEEYSEFKQEYVKLKNDNIRLVKRIEQLQNSIMAKNQRSPDLAPEVEPFQPTPVQKPPKSKAQAEQQIKVWTSQFSRLMSHST